MLQRQVLTFWLIEILISYLLSVWRQFLSHWVVAFGQIFVICFVHLIYLLLHTFITWGVIRKRCTISRYVIIIVVSLMSLLKPISRNLLICVKKMIVSSILTITKILNCPDLLNSVIKGVICSVHDSLYILNIWLLLYKLTLKVLKALLIVQRLAWIM